MHARQSTDGVQHLRVGVDAAGTRLDRHLARALGVPRNRLFRALRKGEIRVNGRRAAPSYRLQDGDDIRVPPLSARDRDPPAEPPESLRAQVRDAVLAEGPDFVAIDKPAGVIVHSGSRERFGVIEALRAERPDADALQLVHRLDRDSSGVLLLAKNREAARSLGQALRARDADKRYLLLAGGGWQGDAHTVRASLRKNVIRGGERKVVVHRSGQRATTTFSAIERHQAASLLQASIETGRTHQIRVHAAHIGHPVVGDRKYGDPALNRWAERELGLRRVFLHAHRLCITAPQGGTIDVTAPLSEELQRALEALRAYDRDEVEHATGKGGHRSG